MKEKHTSSYTIEKSLLDAASNHSKYPFELPEVTINMSLKPVYTHPHDALYFDCIVWNRELGALQSIHHRFPIPEYFVRRRADIRVMVNNSMLEDHEYQLDYVRLEIVLHKRITTEENVQIFLMPPTKPCFLNVLLLKRGEFSDEQLQSFLPSVKDAFSIDRLIPNNQVMGNFKGAKGIVMNSRITEKGIVGDLIVNNTSIDPVIISHS